VVLRIGETDRRHENRLVPFAYKILRNSIPLAKNLLRSYVGLPLPLPTGRQAGRGREEGSVREFRNVSWRKVGRRLTPEENQGKIIEIGSFIRISRSDTE